MTREVLAQVCEEAARGYESGIVVPKFPPVVVTSGALLAAAAELRKTCGTCQHFDATRLDSVWESYPEQCLIIGEVPPDGSGFCHLWEGKE